MRSTSVRSIPGSTALSSAARSGVLLQVTSDLNRDVGHNRRLYGTSAYCEFLAHTVCPYFRSVNPLNAGMGPAALRWWPVSPESAPSREVLEGQARRLLELARERTGASVE